MTRFYNYIYVLLALLLTACSEDLIDRTATDDGTEINVKLNVDIPTWKDVATRAASADNGIQNIQMLCFDKDGFYLGLSDATITKTSDYKGTLTAKVPSTTCRIHFIANANLSDNASWIGMFENTLITSLIANEGDEMVYWGYRKEDTAADMKTFLEGNNTVYMLRNMTKVSVVNNTANNSEGDIEDVKLLVFNDADKGTLAPFDLTNSTNPYIYDTTDGAEKATVPSDAGKRQPSIESNDIFNDASDQQYIFESTNSALQPVCVILKVTYNSGGKVKYHKIHLLNANHEFYDIRRNHNYQITIEKLDPDLGSDSFKEALSANPSNNQFINVDDIVPSISNGKYTLTIVGKTSVVYNEAGDKEVEFTYSGDTDMTADNFEVVWLSTEGMTAPALTLEYNGDTDKGKIKFNIAHVSDNMQKGTLFLLDKKHGLSRRVKIYAINPFEFNAELVKTGENVATYSLTCKEQVVCTDRLTKTISFIYSGDDNMTTDDFTIEWETNPTYGYWNSDYVFGKYPYISKSRDQFYISIYANITSSQNSNNPYTGTLKITDTKHGITKTITVYATSSKNYSDGEEITTTKTIIISNKYNLTFTVPDNYPEDLLPIEVKIATNTITPTSTTDEDKLGVVVESTKNINNTSVVADQWNEDWDFWYVKKNVEVGTHTIEWNLIDGKETGGNVYLKADYFKPIRLKVPD